MALNWGGAASGALTGAGTGAVAGPWGVAGGAVLGGLLGLLGGDDDELSKLETQTPEQKALQNQILAQAMGMSQNGGYQQAQDYFGNFLGNNQQQAFNQFSAPYLQQFQEQILPRIAERFAGGGALSSSGFGQALGGAGSNLQAQLAQLFSSLQSQAAGAITNQYNQLAATGLGHEQFAYKRKPGSLGFGAPFLAGMSGELGKASGNALGQGIADLFKPRLPPGTPGGGIA